MTVVVTALQRQHDRSNFDCGEPALNQFLQRLARQQSERDFNRTYVATQPDQARIHGYYAISSAAIDFEIWPAHMRLPRYPVPVARIGRLAVDLRAQSRGVGRLLLQHAMQLCAATAQQIGLFAVVVEAKHEAAAGFYERYGFMRFERQPLSLFLTTDVIRRALAKSVNNPGNAA